MDRSSSFGYWLRRRRKALDLTQEDLAQQVACSVETVKKIETDVRRPSRQMAERLADCLAIPLEERSAFLKAARAELAADRLPPDAVPVGPGPAALPSGTVTFLFTDIAGSTQLWEQHPQAMPAALARHDAILRQQIAAHGGQVFKTMGDAVCAAFVTAPDALTAGLAIQRALGAEDWGATGPLRVRLALHTGVAELRDGDYFGPALNRVARLLSAGHGGQTLLSAAAWELVRDHLPADVALRDLGEHRLKDLSRPDHIFQLVAPDLPADFPPLRTLESRRTNLPIQPTALIGREKELAAIHAILPRADVRLLTLTGPGGIGKTRLAMAAAAEALQDFANGAYVVNLAPISDPALVIATIAQTLGVTESRSRPLLESLKDELREQHLLLLLDNFEQVLTAAPQMAELLAACPKLKLLATSRAVLHLYGEHEFGVPPLALPPRSPYPPTPAPTTGGRGVDSPPLPAWERGPGGEGDLTQYDAVRLFIECAQAVKPDFLVTNTNAPAVAEICYRLDGLPLAIELAAARIKLFPPQALLSRLEHRLALLTGGARDLPARHQTIRGAIDWSYNLLSAAEQTLFARLGVFVGGCTLEAAEAVCNTMNNLPMDATDGVASLLDKSLLRLEEGADGEPRVMMLETIREYALERLAQRGESVMVRDRHLEYYLALAEAAEPHLRGAEQIVWADLLEVEHDNFRAALAWAHDCGAVDGSSIGGAEAELRLAGALIWFWDLRDYLSEGRRWLEEALAQTNGPARTAARAKALYALAQTQVDQLVGRTSLEESVAIWREVGDKRGLALSLSGLGIAMLYERRAGVARSFFEEGVAICRELNDKWRLAIALYGLGAAVRRDNPAAARPIVEESVALLREAGDRANLAGALALLGVIARSEHDLVRAGALYEESLALSRELGNKAGISVALLDLGDVAQDQGDYHRAVTLYQQSLAFMQHLEMKERIAWCLVGLARVAGAVARPERAARLLSAAETLLDAIGLSVSVWPEVRADYDRTLTAVRAQLDTATFAAAWAEGRAMTMEQAIAEALDDAAASIT
jgi:predicted ATPase/class 3 adenylate cyclase/DNA-binding XRE family transcriptional regulator